ncbi:hypothetical protein EVAR_22984_1 [Eumeta japonica]|uniref:Uncharacterized protein n=1 Tax=Eumeta variegata TaxID=151549 RepID=A0A4C1UPY2_EUMVA|nr:hypothetical protein EVAR_22984_1 [Eumeta japonica]
MILTWNTSLAFNMPTTNHNTESLSDLDAILGDVRVVSESNDISGPHKHFAKLKLRFLLRRKGPPAQTPTRGGSARAREHAGHRPGVPGLSRAMTCRRRRLTCA